MVEKIIDAQVAASPEERASWAGVPYSTVTIAGRVVYLFKDRLIVPRLEKDIQNVLMRMAHDDTAHFTGASRTYMQLYKQARVYWTGMQEDIRIYIKSCYKCAFAKAESHSPAKVGQLSPTVAPYVHHTWYVDLKGPMPHGTGYIMVAVEPITRMVKVRFVPAATGKEVCEELEEVMISYGTMPVIIRSDNGPPFDSAYYEAFCKRHRITPIRGVPHHSQGQGMVETRFRPIAAAIMATLGHKAPLAWWRGRLLARLEGIINSTFCEPIHGSPYWAMYGHEPRTMLSACVDWTAANFGEQSLELKEATFEDYNAIIAEHHGRINAVQGRVMIATGLAQAITKRAWDGSREKGDYKIDDDVLVHRTAPNRMLPHFIGPYKVEAVTKDGNFVKLRHYVDKTDAGVMDQVHVSRLLHFDASRAEAADIIDFQLDVGSYVVEDVTEHRVLGDGSYEYKVRWRGNPIQTWMPSQAAKKIVVVQKYCERMSLPAPGMGKVTAGRQPGRRRGR
jgi:hypothetical protein